MKKLYKCDECKSIFKKEELDGECRACGCKIFIKVKKCIDCGDYFKDFSTDNFNTNVCQNCFSKSRIAIDNSFEEEKQYQDCGGEKMNKSIREDIIKKAGSHLKKRKEDLILEAISRVDPSLAIQLERATNSIYKDIPFIKGVIENRLEIRDYEDIPGLVYCLDGKEILRMLEPEMDTILDAGKTKMAASSKYEFLV